MNLFKHCPGISQYFMVPETEYPVAHGFEAGRSFLIFFCAESMLTTIGLDNQFGFDADEVDDIGLYYELAFEFMAAHTVSP
jgi:hypothetical protein